MAGNWHCRHSSKFIFYLLGPLLRRDSDVYHVMQERELLMLRLPRVVDLLTWRQQVTALRVMLAFLGSVGYFC